jgi:hypothetical protein
MCVVASAFILVCLFVFAPKTSAAPLESPNYKLDAQVMNNFGGAGSSTSYKMVSTGGEAIVGAGAGGSYLLSGGYVSQLQQSIELRLNPAQLKAGYQLDTNAGTQVYDGTIANSNGLMVNGPTWIAGKIGRAINFDATNDYVDLGSPSASNITGDATVSVWVKPTNFTTEQGVISWGNGGTTSPFSINLLTTSKVQYACTGCTTRTSTASLTANVWSHVTTTVSGSTLKIYINGVLDSTQDIGISTRSSGNGSLNFGRTATKYMRGGIDEISIFDRALSAQEVRAIYDANAAGVNTAIVIPTIAPGVSQNGVLDMVVATDAGGYNAAVSHNVNLRHTDNATTVPNLNNGGTVATPVLWNEGTTKGLGLTLTGGDSAPPAKWGTGPVSYKYAPISTTATTFYSRTGNSGGTKETTNLQLKLDVPTSQKSGSYSNKLTVTVTTLP